VGARRSRYRALLHVENGLITTAGIVVGCAFAVAIGYWLSLQYQLPRWISTTWSAASSCCGCWVNSPHGSRLVERRQCPHPWLPDRVIGSIDAYDFVAQPTVLVIDDNEAVRTAFDVLPVDHGRGC